FDAGRAAVAEIDDVDLFTFGDPEMEIDELLGNLDPDVEVVDETGRPLLTYVRAAGIAVIDELEEPLRSEEVNSIIVAGYEIFIAGGMSFGDVPSDATGRLCNADTLPESVLQAMGFITDPPRPLVNADDGA